MLRIQISSLAWRSYIYLYTTALSSGKLIFFEESYTNFTWEEGEENFYNITLAKWI